MRDYQFPYVPTLMQKHAVLKLIEKRVYANFCGMGAGKTNAALIASRLTNSRVTVIICPNNVKDTWEESIKKIYPNNTNVIDYTSIKDIIKFDRNVFNYIIFNYDKFSLNNKNQGKNLIDKLLSLNIIDFLCFDEIHFVKSNSAIESNRRECVKFLRLEAEKQNPNIYIYGMTGTPLINSLSEVRSLVELITGKEHPEIGDIASINNIYLANKWLSIIGDRFIPNFGINVDEKFIRINADELTHNIINISTSTTLPSITLPLENILLDKKLSDPNIIAEMTPGTIIYCKYKKNIIHRIIKKLEEYNISCVEYTGDIDENIRKINKDKFINRKADILVATSPISTGVDGLQKIAHKIIIFSYPWTAAEYYQLIGRINRQGSNFDKVTIIHPQVYINTTTGEWNYDESRYNIIKNKQTLSNAVVDGNIDSIYKLDKKKYITKLLNKLKDGIIDYHPKRNDIKVNYTFTAQEYKHSESIIKDIHQKAKTSTSKHMHEWFLNNPDGWKEYHKQREITKTTWLEDPVDVIAKELNERNDTNIIADLGCGLAKLSKIINVPNKVISIDHYSDDPNVIKADIADLSNYICDNEVDITVFCLSLWGTNYLDYIKEAYRITAKRGFMYIVEPSDKFDFDKLKEDIKQIGFNKINEVIRDKFIYLTFIKN